MELLPGLVREEGNHVHIHTRTRQLTAVSRLMWSAALRRPPTGESMSGGKNLRRTARTRFREQSSPVPSEPVAAAERACSTGTRRDAVHARTAIGGRVGAVSSGSSAVAAATRPIPEARVAENVGGSSSGHAAAQGISIAVQRGCTNSRRHGSPAETRTRPTASSSTPRVCAGAAEVSPIETGRKALARTVRRIVGVARSFGSCLRVRLMRLVAGKEAMSTAEYAIGTIAAAAFGAVLYGVVTGDSIVDALTKIIDKALDTSV